jgi:hypothetical protein
MVLFTLYSCEKEPVESDLEETIRNEIVVPDFLDLTDAKSLVAFSGNSVKKSTAGDPHSNGNLYKVKDDGEVVKVMFRDQNGQPFEKIVYYKDNGDSIVNYPSLYVQEINILNEYFLLIEGSFSYLDISDLENPHDVFYESLLLRLSDGALFDFNDKINWYRSCRYKNRYLYTDIEGNLYYTSTSSNDNVQKLSLPEDGEVTRENILPYNQKFKSYCVDGEGNLYYLPDDLGSTYEGFYIKAANNGILMFDRLFYQVDTDTMKATMYTEFQWVWIADDKTAFAVAGKDSAVYNEPLGEWDTHESGHSVFLKIHIDNSTIQYENHLTNVDNLFENFQWKVDQYVYRTSYQDEIIFMYGNVGAQPATELWALDLVNNTYRKGIIPINEGEYVGALIHDGGEYIFLADNSKLLKISKADFSYVNFLPENQYDIIALSVSEDDIVTFNALRYSDASIILGQIDQDGVVTLTKEDMDEPVTTLVRIN